MICGDPEIRNIFDYITMMRRGGRVKRFHTEPIIGEETVGHHSYNVACWVIALTNHEVPRDLLLAAIYHDTDEQVLGDIPGPAKWFASDVINLVESKQREFRQSQGLEIQLTDEQHNTLKWADKLDLLLTCYDQQRLGNKLGLEMCCRVVKLLESLPAHEVGSKVLEAWLLHHPEHYQSDVPRGEYI